MSNEDFEIIDNLEERTYKLIIDGEDVEVNNMKNIIISYEYNLKNIKSILSKKYSIITENIDKKTFIKDIDNNNNLCILEIIEIK